MRTNLNSIVHLHLHIDCLLRSNDNWKIFMNFMKAWTLAENMLLNCYEMKEKSRGKSFVVWKYFGHSWLMFATLYKMRSNQFNPLPILILASLLYPKMKDHTDIFFSLPTIFIKMTGKHFNKFNSFAHVSDIDIMCFCSLLNVNSIKRA